MCCLCLRPSTIPWDTLYLKLSWSASSNFLCLFHLNSLRPDPIPSAILFHLPSFRASFLGFILIQYVASAVRFRYYIMKLHRTNITREYWILIYRRLTRRSGNPVVDLQFHLHVMKFVNLLNNNNNKYIHTHYWSRTISIKYNSHLYVFCGIFFNKMDCKPLFHVYVVNSFWKESLSPKQNSFSK